MPDVGMHSVGEVDYRRAARQGEDLGLVGFDLTQRILQQALLRWIAPRRGQAPQPPA